MNAATWRVAASALIHWPLIVVWLLGAIPGLLIIANTGRRVQVGAGAR
ncbi:hypothetical protein ACQP0U_12375 [Micromonospora sp. CA-269861]